MSQEIVRKKNLEALKRIKTPYPQEALEFINYLESSGQDLSRDGIELYMLDLEQRKRINGNGQKVRYSASWHNQRIKAVKRLVRAILEKSPELTNGQKYSIEKHLQSLRLQKGKVGISKAERVPNRNEIETLIRSADVRLGLIIEFLSETGARITEALGVEVGNARRGKRITRVTILGKGRKSRDLRCRTELYDRIRDTFKGKHYLFEHNGKHYSRISITNRIKVLAEKTIGKPVTAHMVRHYRGTTLSEKLGISKAASELGHSDIRTTKRFYDHSAISDAEFLASLE